MKTQKTFFIINLILAILVLLLIIPITAFTSDLALVIEVALLLFSYIWTPISDLVVLKKLKGGITAWILFIIYHVISITIVSIALVGSYLELLYPVINIAIISYVVSIFYPMIYKKYKKRKDNNIPSILDKHPVKFLYSTIAFTSILIITMAYYSFAQVAFCYKAMSYLKGSTILRFVIFVILLILLILSLILFICGLICKRKESKKLLPIILTPILELVLIFILVISFVPSSVSLYPNSQGRNKVDLEYSRRINLEVGNKTYSAIYMDGNHDEITLVFVGNSMAAYNGYQPLKNYFPKSNSNVLIVDYPMFGYSNAYLSEKNIYEEADLFYNYINNELGYSSDKIRIAGYSIGTGVASYAASKHEAKELILAAPYDNFTNEMNTIFNVFYPPLSWTIQYKFPSDKYAKNINCPVTIISSKTDKLVPHKLSKKLSTCYPNEPTFIALDNATHNETYSTIEVISRILGVEESILN